MTNVVVELIIEITWFAFGQSDFSVKLNDKTDKQNNCWHRHKITVGKETHNTFTERVIDKGKRNMYIQKLI